MLKLLEYAREDAQTDMDLHDVAENIISLAASGKTLSMEDYDVNGLPVRSNFIIDMNTNSVFYYWFNEIQRVTKVEIKTDFKIILN